MPASPRAWRACFDAGLDSVRVSLNSAVKDLYEAYYCPVKYSWEDVEASLALCRRRGAYLSLNLLTLPGVTDRAGEVEALLALVRRHRVDQVQVRSLCIDPLQYLDVARDRGAGGAPLGIREMLRVLRRGAPVGAHRQLLPRPWRAQPAGLKSSWGVCAHPGPSGSVLASMLILLRPDVTAEQQRDVEDYVRTPGLHPPRHSWRAAHGHRHHRQQGGGRP